MPKGIQKSIQVYFSKLRKPVSDHPLHGSSSSVVPDQHQNIPRAGSAGWLLSACKHPRTPSFAGDHRDDQRKEGQGQEDAATLKDVDKFLLENFKSLYKDGEEGEGGGVDESSTNHVVLCESPTFVKTPPSLRASHRFFVSTSADKYSLFDGPVLRPPSSSSSSALPEGPAEDGDARLPGDSLAVLTYSRRPYDDFRRSMQEMVEARSREGPAAALPLDWDFMEELLFCYLRLNEKRAHKYILGAFVDLIVSFRVIKTADRKPPPPSRRPRRKKKAPRETRRRNADSSEERY